jgi:hypothetical protein
MRLSSEGILSPTIREIIKLERKEGLEQGKELGKEQEQYRVVKNMLDRNMS